MGTTSRNPHVAEHHRAVQLIDQVPRGVQAADRVRERGQGLLDVAGRPGRQTEEPGPGPAHEVIVRAGQGQRTPGMAHRARDVAPRLRQRRTVDPDRRRRGAQIVGVRPGSRERLVVSAGGQRGLGVVEPAAHRVEGTRHHQQPSRQDAEDRAPAHHGLRERPHPAQQQAVLPRAAQLRQRRFHQVGGAVVVRGGEGVPHRVRDEVV